MLDTTYQLMRKGIFYIASSNVSPSINLLEILQGVIYEYIRGEFEYEPDWIRFCGYGQSESEDQRVKVQTAIMHDEGSGAALEWALRLKARDQVIRRRNWLIHIGIHMESKDHATLYFAQFYYDHLVGSFSSTKAPDLAPTSLFFLLMQYPRFICKSGSIPLPAGAVALDDTLIDNFLDCVRDPQRKIPVLLISCPDMINPSEAAKLLAGNAIVCWLDNVNTLKIINQALALEVNIKWDTMQILLPFSLDINYHPSFSVSDISRMGSGHLITLLHQAYCENFRADDRRAFVTVDSINLQRERKAMAALQEQRVSLAAEVARLREHNARLEDGYNQLQKKYDSLQIKDQLAELDTYEVMLNEAIAQTDRIKKEITSLTQRLYECMGRDFIPEECGEACMSELQHSIFVCFARLGGRKQ